MPEFLLATPELTEENRARIRSLLATLRSVAGLADRYRGVDAVESVADLAAVPELHKDDLQVALAHLRPRAPHGATWVFQSGGSTGSPQLGYAPTGLYMADVYQHWPVLDRDDIFVNAWNAGKMWGAHFLVNSYVDLAGCVAMNLGGISRVSVLDHLRALERKGAIRRRQREARAIEILDPEYRPSRGVPLVGTIAAGAPILEASVREEVDLEEFLGVENGSFLLRVRGSSMIEDHICDGDLVLVESRTTARDGETVVAVVGEEDERGVNVRQVADRRHRVQPPTQFGGQPGQGRRRRFSVEGGEKRVDGAPLRREGRGIEPTAARGGRGTEPIRLGRRQTGGEGADVDLARQLVDRPGHAPRLADDGGDDR